MSRTLRYLSRLAAYFIALLLAVVWVVNALDTLFRPLFDIGRAQVGDTIIAVAGRVLKADHLLPFAHLLGGLKFMVGALLLTALVGAVIEKVRFGSCDDALLDVALFVAASGLAIYGRGYLIRQELPRPVRPPFGYAPHWQ